MKTAFLKALIIWLLLSTFCLAWAHVHAPAQDRGDTCLLCQWTGTTAFEVDVSAGLPAPSISGYLSLLSGPTVSETVCDFPCGRSPPAVSFS
ncbi:MAG: hypothetical protein A3F84_26735 [Candidatus Handelsmanbacteria bacterium RIFCSPLOWO2_12_FULL_64_10]|uniref:Uncharacterized protein n=1 Tax=Handelsmanbacteria sp. (strain RIFCSPLOWO2_12_FULL_64_10) TaxID=1817868 RepID=A0A1F6CIP0_HANXR|nr:MAG: hypothetical protein A3F84_26735 [Candidatus Handelsmanbacteria bacterium RIFCSPLOWO2_12_FULL_64_10]